MTITAPTPAVSSRSRLQSADQQLLAASRPTAPWTPWSLDASADLSAGPTTDAFNQYVAVDADIPTAAKSTDAELLASVASASQLMMSKATNSINYQIQRQQTPSAKFVYKHASSLTTRFRVSMCTTLVYFNSKI